MSSSSATPSQPSQPFESEPFESQPFDPSGVAWTGVSPRLLRVRFIVMALSYAPLLIGALVTAWFMDGLWRWLPLVLVGLAAVWSAWLIPRQVRAIGYAERAEDLLIRRGVMFRTLSVVPYGRMQFVDVQAGPIDRWCGVAQVQLHTASAHTDASIPGLPPEEAARLRDHLSARGESRLAGL